MKLINLLKETIVSDKKFKKIISEISASKKTQLIGKFKNETSDSEKDISFYIDEFEKYKNGLEPNKRDIMRYSYDELKNLILGKKSSKSINDLFDDFKKRESKIPNDELKKYLKRFLEIESGLSRQQKNISNIRYLELVQFLNENYLKIISKKLFEKFKKENPNLNLQQISYYIDEFANILDEIPVNTKRIDQMSFSEFEHLIDGIQNKTQKQNTDSSTLSDIDMRYDDNNLKIFAPKSKEQCIKLRNGRSWCTSREGGGNMYYNYRLDNERTLYYVIDEDKDFNDLDFAVVVLVDPNGGMALADGSNSGKYSGHDNVSWRDIVTKIPKLANLKSIFVPEPLTAEEKELIKKVRNVYRPKDLLGEFGDWETVGVWLEVNSPNLSDELYLQLPTELKKKYIALGMELTGPQIRNSEQEVISYYFKKREEALRNSTLNRLTTGDIELLNSKFLRRLKEELKPKFAKDAFFKEKSKIVNIEFPKSDVSKFVALYGIQELFNSLPADMEELYIINRSDQNMNLVIPEEISNFKNLKSLLFEKCVYKLPNSLGELKNLETLSAPDNEKLQSIPESVLSIPSLVFINVRNTNVKLTENLAKVFHEQFKGTGFYIREEI